MFSFLPTDGRCDERFAGTPCHVYGHGSEKGLEKISAKVPLKEMNKYHTSLSSITGGRGVFNISFDRYEKVPADVQDELLKAYEAEQEEE
jgi:elongation factor G